MGVRGIDELVAVLPPTAAGPARAIGAGLADLASLRHSALAPEEVRALGEVWERFTAQVASGRLGVLAAIDARDDVIPKARVGEAGAVFATHALGQRPGTARRDARWASLLRPEVGDLPAIGAAFAAGHISAGHVEVAVRAHRELGAAAREALVECQIPGTDTPDTDTPDTDTPDTDTPGTEPAGTDPAATDPAGTGPATGDDTRGTGPAGTGPAGGGGDGGDGSGLGAVLAGLSEGFTARVRQIRVVDAMLAYYARHHTVTELEALAHRIVQELNPPTDTGAHERRYLHMSQLPDGTWVGKFSCGPAQGLLIKRALNAGSGPRPGTAIDQDGVEHPIPDTRDFGARQIDALHDLLTIALAKTTTTLTSDPTTDTATGTATDTATGTATDTATDTATGTGSGEGNETRERSGQRNDQGSDQGSGQGPADDSAPDPDVPLGEHAPNGPLDEPPPSEGEAVVLREPGVLAGPYPSVDLVLVAGIEHVAAAWAHHRDGQPLDLNLEQNFDAWLRDRLKKRTPPQEQPDDEESPPGQPPPHEQPAEEQCTEEPRTEEPCAEEPCTEQQPGAEQPAQKRGGVRQPAPGWPGWIGRVLSPYAVPAHLEQAGSVDANTLQLLACNATIRAALLAPNGALLDLGRTQRLATPAQKTALLARDGGCVIPGCTVPGDACHAHHVQWWERGGPTDLNNLALVCPRHHTEVHQETWEIRMLEGIPWVVPPRWIDPCRPLLRNAAHHPNHNRHMGPWPA